MEIRRMRQILKTFSDDTRLRIVVVLGTGRVNVGDLCTVLGKSQSNVSKHLTRLRLTGLVSDKREGLNVFYFLRRPADKNEARLIDSITKVASFAEAVKKDTEALQKLRKEK
jgi:DNA-binding transcriptional ArsR family regulator